MAVAWATACPGRNPASAAAVFKLAIARLRPTRPTMTIGVSGGGALLPRLRRSRSVGHCGRKTEMTLGVTGFNLDVEGFTGTATNELKEPAGATHAGGWKGG